MIHLLVPGLPQQGIFSGMIRELVVSVSLNFVMFHSALNRFNPALYPTPLHRHGHPAITAERRF